MVKLAPHSIVKGLLFKLNLYYLDFVQLWCISVTFGFAFGAFESLPQHFGLFEMVQNFEVSDLAMAKVEKVNVTDIYI